MTEAEALDAMHAVAPRDWWQFVGCPQCNSSAPEPCLMGGASWPTPARKPHASRYRTGLALFGALWLIRNGYAADIIKEQP